MRCLLALVLVLESAVAAASSPDPVILRPDLGRARLQTDISKPPHQPVLPPDLAKPGAAYWGMFKICVSAGGEVSTVNVLKSTDQSALDAAWSSTIRGWRHQP